MSITRRSLLSAVAGSALAAPVLASTSATQAAAATPSSWLDPYASAASTPTGRMIKSLAAYRGLLYPGYGDWGANIGPIPIYSFNPATGVFSTPLLSFPGESAERRRILNGALYVSNTDPRTSWEDGQPFASNASGAWAMSGGTNAIHALDITALTDGTLISVGANYDAATGATGRSAWFSYDRGASWSSASMPSPSGTYTRFYTILNTKGGVLLTAENGTVWKWTGLKPVAPRNAYEPYFTQVKASTSIPWNVACASNGSIALYGSYLAHNGTTSWSVPSGFRAVESVGGYLYAATATQIYRTTDAHRWSVCMTGQTLPVSSMAVMGTTAYLGTTDSRILPISLRNVRWTTVYK